MPKRAGVMLCYPFEEKRFTKWNDSVIVQPKLDGERARALISMNPIFYSSEVTREDSIGCYDSDCLVQIPSDFGTTIRNFAIPSLVEEAKLFYIKSGLEIELDGELYLHGMDFNDR